MAHPEQMEFVAQVAAMLPQFFTNTRVLEIGSRNINGTVRKFFTDSVIYVGVDCTPGNMVDIVSLAHEFRAPTQFDTVISCEAFEHDPHFQETIDNIMDNLLREGGLFVATWASPTRQEHGTRASTGSEIYGPDEDYYKGISVREFEEAVANRLDPLHTKLGSGDVDVYAWGFR